MSGRKVNLITSRATNNGCVASRDRVPLPDCRNNNFPIEIRFLLQIVNKPFLTATLTTLCTVVHSLNLPVSLVSVNAAFCWVQKH